MYAMVDNVLDECRSYGLSSLFGSTETVAVTFLFFFFRLFFFCAIFFFHFPSLAATQIFSAGQDFAQLFGSYLEQFTCFLCCSLQEKLPVKFQPDSCSQNSCGTVPGLSCHSRCVVFQEEDFLQLFLQFFL